MPAVRGDGMRGLAVFISDIRNCKLKFLFVYFSIYIFKKINGFVVYVNYNIFIYTIRRKTS